MKQSGKEFVFAVWDGRREDVKACVQYVSATAQNDDSQNTCANAIPV